VEAHYKCWKPACQPADSFFSVFQAMCR